MKVLITGSTGLLGQMLTRHLGRSCDVTGLSRRASSIPAFGRHLVCDLLDPSLIADVLQEVRPEVVINAQALSDVDRCEVEPELALAMNVQTISNLVDAMRKTGALLIHISSDYVFDGMKGSAYNETDEPNPISVYGRSKLESERIALSYERGIIVRTGTLFGPGRMNFCDYAVSRLAAGKSVEAFIDQVTSPTYAHDLAEAIGKLCVLPRQSAANPARVYHISNAGACSRVVFVERIADILGCPKDLIRRIHMKDQKRPAARPPYSALASIHLNHAIGKQLRSWADALLAYLVDKGEHVQC